MFFVFKSHLCSDTGKNVIMITYKEKKNLKSQPSAPMGFEPKSIWINHLVLAILSPLTDS